MGEEISKEIRREEYSVVTVYTVGVRNDMIYARKNRYFDDGDERGIEYSLSETKAEIRWWEWGELVGTCSAPYTRDEEFFREMKKEIEEADETDVRRLYSLLKDIIKEAYEDCDC